MSVFNVKSKKSTDGVLRIDISGDLDNETYSQLETFLKEAFEQKASKILVDFTQVYGFCSAAEYVLIWANETVIENGGKLALVCGNKNVLELMQAFGLDKLLNLFESAEEALQFLA